MEIAVTGANGFLGTHVVRALAAAGHRVRGVVLAGTPLGDAGSACAQVVEADVRDPASLRPALAGTDAVVHLAARVADSGPPRAFSDINVQGTRHVRDEAIRAGVRRLVFVSSLAVHGFGDFLDAPEDTPYSWQTNAYARSKIACEGLLARAWARGDVEAVVVRPAFFPYGEHDRLSLPTLVKTLASGVFPLPGGRDPWIGTVHGDNFAEGVRLALTHPAAAGGTFVLGDGGGVRLKELMRTIARLAGLRPPRFLPLPLPLALGAAALVEAAWAHLPLPGLAPLTPYRVRVGVHDLHFSDARARRVLGYRPPLGREEGLARALGALRQRA